MPDRGLRFRGWCGGHLGEQNQDIGRRLERRQPTPVRLRGARELPGVERNSRLRIAGVQMQMMEAWGRKHISPSFLKAQELGMVYSQFFMRNAQFFITRGRPARSRMRVPVEKVG